VPDGLRWLIVLPLAAASWLSAHCLAYLLVPPASGEHAHVQSASDHAAFGFTPLLIACGVALVAAGLAVCVRDGLRGRRQAHPPAVVFAVLPIAGFTVQEHLEHAIGSGAVPYDVIAEPTFLAGLALQAPFAVAALLLARGLYAVGYGLGSAVAHGVRISRPVPGAPCLLVRAPLTAPISPPSVLALGHGQRAPPSGPRS
jgi:hypothetical protein